MDVPAHRIGNPQRRAAVGRRGPRADETAALPDAVLLRCAGGGDAAAFATLYERHAGMVRNVARRILRDDVLVDDICQETFLRLWVQARTYQPERGAVAGWLYRIAHNLALDEYRRRRSQRARLVFDGTADARTALVPDREPGPEQIALAAALHESLARGLHALPSAEAQVVTMAYIGGLTQREVAVALDLSLGRVKHRIARGLRGLRADPGLARIAAES